MPFCLNGDEVFIGKVLHIKMRSRHADTFNHDADASDYDRIVRIQADPIRTGYGEVLSWVAREAEISASSVVVDLGVGTGNTSQLIRDCAALIGVDVSSNMMAIAGGKLEHLNSVQFVKADLLEYFQAKVPMADAYVSTYTVHHLMDDEKEILFQLVFDNLKPDGRAVFGDLMFEHSEGRASVIERLLRQGHSGAVDDIAEEYFWDVSGAVEALDRIGFEVTLKRFSDLSWGIACRKRSAGL